MVLMKSNWVDSRGNTELLCDSRMIHIPVYEVLKISIPLYVGWLLYILFFPWNKKKNITGSLGVISQVISLFFFSLFFVVVVDVVVVVVFAKLQLVKLYFDFTVKENTRNCRNANYGTRFMMDFMLFASLNYSEAKQVVNKQIDTYFPIYYMEKSEKGVVRNVALELLL